jgi:predicted Rossmann-fold nucleotide-binding protein
MRETRGRSIRVQPLSRGGISLPPGLPVDPYRHGLYSADELYDADEYAATSDARAYAWSLRPASHDDTLARALHDHAVDEALAAWIGGRRLAGVMGGHALQRDDPTYADAARLGHLVGTELVVATGGGPGAMEAANLGAWLARHPAADLAEAVRMLAEVPTFRPSVTAWAQTAFHVRERFPDGADSLGIPTWHYGHEPTSVFPTAIAKYFRNSSREAILLEVCDAGIAFLPGAAGTVQEVFQDACENYYADESSVAPMVLVGATYWTETVPVWPLLSALARDRTMAPHLHLVDSVEEAANLLVSGT